MSERIIHIQWDGPFSPSKLDTLCDTNRDYGLYAIYGHHSVYGSGVLLYIGKARDRTFGQRIPEEKWDTGSMEDPAHVEIYVGRLKGQSTPPESEWKRSIDLAEKLLIHTHGPAYNMTCMQAVPENDQDVRNTRVFNWGRHRDLRHEVSGQRWTSAANETASYQVYDRSKLSG